MGQRLAHEFGATDIEEARGEEGIAAVKELTGGIGAHSVIEAVGTSESMGQASGIVRPAGHIGFVGVPHEGVPGASLFWSPGHVFGGPAPVRQFLPEPVELIWERKVDPGQVFDLSLPLDDAGEGYRATDERRAIKTLPRP